MTSIIRPLKPRDSHEPHRVATPLELLFDLVSVIAIATAAAGLHHAIAEAHATQGVIFSSPKHLAPTHTIVAKGDCQGISDVGRLGKGREI